jgi:quercetin dioxygenase-like cupin family protein
VQSGIIVKIRGDDNMKIQQIKDRIAFHENTFTKRVIFNEEKVLAFVLNMMPGQEIPPHQHEESDLVLHVMTGGAELTVDGKTQNITVGDVIHCVGSEVFSMKNNTNENLSCFVVIAPRPTPKLYAEEFGNK